jgi:hypothetical protein
MAGYPVHGRRTPRRRCSWRAMATRRLARPHAPLRQRWLHDMSPVSTSGRQLLVRTLAVTESEHPASVTTTRHSVHNDSGRVRSPQSREAGGAQIVPLCALLGGLASNRDAGLPASRRSAPVADHRPEAPRRGVICSLGLRRLAAARPALARSAGHWRPRRDHPHRPVD